jgi:hypothetical protein
MFCQLVDRLYLLDLLKEVRAPALSVELTDNLMTVISTVLRTAPGTDISDYEAQVEVLQASASACQSVAHSCNHI